MFIFNKIRITYNFRRNVGDSFLNNQQYSFIFVCNRLWLTGFGEIFDIQLQMNLYEGLDMIFYNKTQKLIDN